MEKKLDLTDTSFRNHPDHEKVARILRAALEAVDPYQAVNRVVRISGDDLIVGGRSYSLRKTKRIWVIGAGKASAAMASAAADILGSRMTGAAIVAKTLTQGKNRFNENVGVFLGDHPVPGEKSIHATRNVLNLLEDPQSDDLVFCVISGGGSALFTDPVNGVSLQDLQLITKELLSCGATIQEINTLRKHLDTIKGGGLLKRTAPAQVISLILSDVVGSDLSTIASGPTSPDPTTYGDAWEVLKRYQVIDRVPIGIREAIQKGIEGILPETVKPEGEDLRRVQNLLVASNEIAARAALQQAVQEGFHPLLLTTSLQGEASQAGIFLSSILQQCAASGEPVQRPACIVAGGETTVIVRGEGQGGRNQELALGSVDGLNGLENAALITLATDGEDGATGAAGAIVTGETARRAAQQGMKAAEYLRENNSFAYFNALNDLLWTGSTGTNVNDLTFLFTFNNWNNY